MTVDVLPGLAVAMALRYVHILSHVGGVLSGS